ncbi:MAG: signal recognition particle protein [Candidatus Bipolaricaulota bacterium]|nr:signal recognition particle protein [Candidatus Bipolaricaulota bacterium]
MFDALTDKLNNVFSRLRGKGKLSQGDVDAGLREIRLALLEADVNYKVVKWLVDKIRQRAVGGEVLESLTPGQQVVKIVRDELTALMGDSEAKLSLDRRPASIMLVGLQGSGKTTTAAKMGLHLKKQGRKPLLVAADVRRPAAIDQLKTLGESLELPVVADKERQPCEIVKTGIRWAQDNLCDVILIDTAGRLQIDEQMMSELEEIKDVATPEEILLVADAMTGQEAVNIAVAFDQRIKLSGVVLTKLDGDARGGAALSIRHVTGRPIKFVGVGERPPDLQPFHPDRMAARVLGMGDVLSLVEQAEQKIDKKRAEKVAKRIKQDRFTLDDFLGQLEEMRKMGPLAQILERLPGGGKLKGNADVDEQEIDRALAILRSMTVQERLNPSIIGGSRKRRIARGSGTTARDINRVLSRFKEAKKALKLVGKKGGRGRSPLDLLGM